MQIGLFHSIQWPEGSNQRDRYDQALTQACRADEAGFDSVWLTEHHFSRHGIVSDSLMVLAHLAARTSHVRLGTAVSVLPLHHPVRFAEAVATVDQLSRGRLDLGIGRGYQPGEFRGFANGRTYTLANGPVWKQVDDASLVGIRLTDTPVVITPSIAGNVWYMSVGRYGTRAKVQRVK